MANRLPWFRGAMCQVAGSIRASCGLIGQIRRRQHTSGTHPLHHSHGYPFPNSANEPFAMQRLCRTQCRRYEPTLKRPAKGHQPGSHSRISEPTRRGVSKGGAFNSSPVTWRSVCLHSNGSACRSAKRLHDVGRAQVSETTWRKDRARGSGL